jgi:RNA-directed DNA polymerase
MAMLDWEGGRSECRDVMSWIPACNMVGNESCAHVHLVIHRKRVWGIDYMKETQMTVAEKSATGAPSATPWNAMRWQPMKKSVRRLQMRIAKAVREGHHHKAKALQWLLTHSYSAKLLAVKRVTENRGKDTPGIDGVVWKTTKQKMQGALALKRHGYQPQPLRRIYIPKKSGGKRPLSIPTIKDRAYQALHLLALEPVVEMTADRHAYGFRPYRSCADAREQCFTILAKKCSATWILEGDIKSCFDTISRCWLLANTPVDRVVLRKWLQAGYLENETLYKTEQGTPQGGIISPCLLVNTLSGLEAAVKAVTKRNDKVNICVYADDFIITGANRQVLEDKVKPAVQTFLAERGLALSETKTRITHIDEGFDFLGFNIRKYKGKLLIKPAKASIKHFLGDIRRLIGKNNGVATFTLIRQLNPRIRGWCNYYRHAVAKKIFNKVDHCINQALQRWIKRRHPEKSASWRRKRYFRREKLRNWIFHAKDPAGKGTIDIYSAGQTRIVRHVKIRGNANPYDPSFTAYLKLRYAKRLAASRTTGSSYSDGLRMARAV